VGKLALVAVLSIISLGGVGIRSSDAFVEGLCASLAAVIALAIGGAMLWYSDRHPREATLEGMEVVVLEQQKYWAESASRDKPKYADPSATITIPDPNRKSIEGQ